MANSFTFFSRSSLTVTAEVSTIAKSGAAAEMSGTLDIMGTKQSGARAQASACMQARTGCLSLGGCAGDKTNEVVVNGRMYDIVTFHLNYYVYWAYGMFFVYAYTCIHVHVCHVTLAANASSSWL